MEGNFALGDAVLILGRTPAVLRTLLQDLPEAWIRADEGPETWSPYEVMGHLIHGRRPTGSSAPGTSWREEAPPPSSHSTGSTSG